MLDKSKMKLPKLDPPTPPLRFEANRISSISSSSEANLSHEKHTSTEFPYQKLNALRAHIHKVIIGQDEALDLILTALLAGGHALMEDVPGIGKTTLASTLAKSLSLSFARVQFTPDVMPSDITGYNIYNPQKGQFEFHEGAVMCQILLADEINRCSPKTQSALLEAMQDHQVTVDGQSYPLADPFLVIATQNSIEQLGTYPLPEAQLDRFMLRFSLGYPRPENEMRILKLHGQSSPLKNIQAILNESDVHEMQAHCRSVYTAEAILEYITLIAQRSRNYPEIKLGLSPRGSLLLLQAAKARALLQNRDYVLPADIQYLAPFVLSHRIVLSESAQLAEKAASDVVKQLILSVPVPPAQ